MTFKTGATLSKENKYQNPRRSLSGIDACSSINSPKGVKKKSAAKSDFDQSKLLEVNTRRLIVFF
jgi:hypothetical protein